MCVVIAMLAGCTDAWRAPDPTAEEYDRGLIVLYPGVFNTTDELWSLYMALRYEGADRAIEVKPWGPANDPLYCIGAYAENRAWSVDEAARIKSYMDSYPGRPVDLIGFSAGAAIAIWTAEALPAEVKLDRVVLISAGVSADYDLGPMLDHIQRGGVHYFSTLDGEALFSATVFGMMDLTRGAPAGSVGFSMQRDDFIQFPYSSEMADYGNSGNHADILSSPSWFSKYVIPYVLQEP